MSEADAAAAAPRWRRWALLVLAVLLPAAFLLGFAVFALRAFSPPDPPLRETDGIVVLTGGSERVATGLRLLTEGLAPRLLISGAHPEVGLADIAQAAGIDPAPVARQVTIGRAAATTRGNAVETAAWVRADVVRSLRVVTASYHMPRALLELRRADAAGGGRLAAASGLGASAWGIRALRARARRAVGAGQPKA